MNTPLWLLDVDGVLNAFSKDPVWSDWQQGFATAAGRKWSINWSPSVINFINEMHNSGKVEVQWATTWEDEANGELADLIGISNFKVAAFDTCHRDSAHVDCLGWFKGCAVNALQQAGNTRPIIWTDDHINGQKRIIEKLALEDALLISPDEYQGLAPAHLTLIKNFVEDYA